MSCGIAGRGLQHRPKRFILCTGIICTFIMKSEARNLTYPKRFLKISPVVETEMTKKFRLCPRAVFLQLYLFRISATRFLKNSDHRGNRKGFVSMI